LNKDELYIQRCFELAKLGGKSTKTNPMVGAVLVYQDRIIGEGYHEEYGEAHAEVNAIKSVKKEDQHLIKDATLYVSLEPCCFTGKTPACTNLILDNEIKDVRISATDPFPEVNGKGIEILREKGVQVTTGILKSQGQQLIKKFICNNIEKRPYIVLKIVESADGFIGQEGKQVWLSNEASKTLSHKWRSEIDGILVGTNTAVIDNPRLNTRMVSGDNPTRVVFDFNERIPKSNHLISDDLETIIITRSNSYQLDQRHHKTIVQIDENTELSDILSILHDHKIYSLLIEGGASLINSFVKEGLWDECRVIRCPILLKNGIKSPLITMKYVEKYELNGDLLVLGHPSAL